MIVDFHVHVFPPHIKADRALYLERDAGFRELYSSPKARIATADDLLTSMDEAGVDISVLMGFGWKSAELCREHSDYLLDAASRHPDRLIAMCTIQPAAGAPALAELQRCVERGARGMGELRPEEQGYLSENWGALSGIAEWAGPRGLPAVVHASEPVGHLYPGKGRMTPDVLQTLVQTYPDWPLVLAHLGGGLPFYATMPEVHRSLANVWVDTAAWPLLYDPSAFSALAMAFGTERILFASDFPLLSQQRVLDAMSALQLPEAVLAGILGENAGRLLRI